MKGRIDPPVIVAQLFEVPVDVVWQAITDREQMVKWFFEEIVAFEPRVGFTTSFAIENEGRIFTHLWHILEVVPQSKIVYNWQYREYNGDSTVTFELFPTEKGCRLQLTHRFLKGFPNAIPEFKRESCLEGWNYFINYRLAEYIAQIIKPE